MSANFFTDNQERLIATIKNDIQKNPSLNIGFSGELGVGKTTLIKNILATIDKKFLPQVSSPTFSYCNIYQEKLLVAHFDLYRLQSVSDLVRIDIWDYLSTSALVFIEWVDRFPAILAECDLVVEIGFGSRNSRCYQVKKI